MNKDNYIEKVKQTWTRAEATGRPYVFYYDYDSNDYDSIELARWINSSINGWRMATFYPGTSKGNASQVPFEIVPMCDSVSDASKGAKTTLF